MTDKEFFFETLDRLANKHGFTYDRPYGNGYIVLNINGKEFDFNADGYTLLYNLKTLVDILDIYYNV